MPNNNIFKAHFQMIDYDVVITIILTTLLILILIAGITISFFMVSRQRANQQIELTRARLKYEKELRKVEGELSEQLMQHFGQELHDNIGHLLTCLRLEVENRKLDNPQLCEVLKSADHYLEETSVQLRLLSRSLNTDYLANIGLNEAIQLEVDRQKNLKKFQIQWEHNYSRNEIDKDQELIIFRIFQEVVNNAIRHSSARNLCILLKDYPYFELIIKDDGCGFKVQETLDSLRSSGLRNIIKRSEIAKINCKIASSPGHGCTYILRKDQKKT